MQEQKVLLVSFIIVACLIAVLIGCMALILFLYQKRQHGFLRSVENLKKDYESELLKSQLETQERTMMFISQEIHDNIGQELSLVKLNLGSMEVFKELNHDELTSSTKASVSKVIHALRDLSRLLNTDYVSQVGLQQAIQYELDMIKRSRLIETSMTQEGDTYKLEGKKEVVLFRMAQEILNNSIKHADGTQITVLLSFQVEAFNLIISDNGQGFDCSSIKENNQLGQGIRNMRNRASVIGATYGISSTLGKGTTVIITLPI